MDLVYRGSNAMAVYPGNGDGTFQAVRTAPVRSGVMSAAAADFNRDGKLDLAASHQNNGGVSVVHGNGDFTFRPYQHYPGGGFPSSTVTADFNRDGRPDIAQANAAVSGLTVLLGTGGTVSDGVIPITARFEDLAGNMSPFSAARDVTLDTQAPAAPPAPRPARRQRHRLQQHRRPHRRHDADLRRLA